jgi:alkaline phosphatase
MTIESQTRRATDVLGRNRRPCRTPAERARPAFRRASLRCIHSLSTLAMGGLWGLLTLLPGGVLAQQPAADAPAAPAQPAADAAEEAARKVLAEASAVDVERLDPIARLQHLAVLNNSAEFGHWGPDATKYSSWKSHSNRLIPLYVFGGDLARVSGENSLYRSPEQIEQLYGRLPPNTLNPNAEYCDQTDAYRLQKWAAEAGKKRIVLFVFDGMDWQTTWAAAIAQAGAVTYDSGRGDVLAFQTYRGAPTDFGFYVTSPHNDGTNIDVDQQRVTNPGGKTPGGYDPNRAGTHPWDRFPDPLYPIAKGDAPVQAYTDSASSATSLTSGIKTYNDAINVDFAGRGVEPISRTLQDQGFAIGVVTSVPISHATPAAAYSSNVHRDDYQDLTRDLIGLPSVFHPGGLPGVDVLIGSGWGEIREKDGAQGKNFVAGNRYLTDEDKQAIDIAHGGQYVVAERTPGQSGPEVLRQGVERAQAGGHRLLGFFGLKGGHLPFRTADGGYDPVIHMGSGGKPEGPEKYSPADLMENPTLTDMTLAALDVLQSRSDRWWLMVEAGDVDWANHANSIDASIGAVISGDEAFAALAKWIEQHGGWDDALVILTADHGHYLVLEQPEVLAAAARDMHARKKE